MHWSGICPGFHEDFANDCMGFRFFMTNFTFLLSLFSAYFFRSSQSFNYFRPRNSTMRPTLLLILLFTLLGGYHPSATHVAVGSQAFHHSRSQPSLASQGITYHLSAPTSVYTGTFGTYFTTEDMEDDENRHDLSFRKSKMLSGSALASAYILTLSRLHGNHLVAAPISSTSSGKYITQRTLRI